MEETAKMEKNLSSDASFVEGGIQHACDDACSICLEEFCEGDPSTVTGCKHEFHLQCILEWCQRSSQCPMCWQSICLKDPTSQELLDAVEQERNIRQNQRRTTTIFRHPALGDFELHNLPLSGSDAELEERIMQHLAAAAAMGRVQHNSHREGQRGRSGSHRYPQLLVFSPHPNAPYVGYRSASSARGENESTPAVFTTSPSSTLTAPAEESTNQEPHITPAQADRGAVIATETSNTQSRPSLLTSRTSAGRSTPVIQDRPGPSDFQSFSESLRSRLNSASMRYKESIAKSIRGWRERLFSRNSAVAGLGSEVRRELNAGTDMIPHMINCLETRDNRSGSFELPNAVVRSAAESNNEGITRNHDGHPNNITALASTSSPN